MSRALRVVLLAAWGAAATLVVVDVVRTERTRQRAFEVVADARWKLHEDAMTEAGRRRRWWHSPYFPVFVAGGFAMLVLGTLAVQALLSLPS